MATEHRTFCDVCLLEIVADEDGYDHAVKIQITDHREDFRVVYLHLHGDCAPPTLTQLVKPLHPDTQARVREALGE